MPYSCWAASLTSPVISLNLSAGTPQTGQLLLYGLKGVAAYADHAAVLGQRDPELNAFVYEALAAGMPDKDGTPDKARSLEDWLYLVLRCGKANLKAMELLRC